MRSKRFETYNPGGGSHPVQGKSARPFYGWIVLGILWFLFMNFSLMMYGGSILNAYMARSLNMPRDSFGFGVSIAFLAMGLGAPLTAIIVKKVGVRKTLFTGILLLAFGSLSLSFLVKNALGFTLSFGLVCGTGLSMGGLLPLQTMVASWFQRRRTMATAVLLSAGGVGGLVSAYLFTFLIETLKLTWQSIWLGLAVNSLMLAVLSLIFLRNTPQEVGQFPYGASSLPGPSDPQKARHSYRTTEVWSFREAVRSPVLWLILVGGLGMAVTYEFCAAYSVIHLMDIGFPNQVASFSVGILSFFAIVGRLATGYLGEKLPLRWLMAVGSLLIACGAFLLIAPPSSPVITIYALLAGLGQGIVFVGIFTILPDYFGSQALPSLLGLGMPFSALMNAGMLYLGGILRAQTGSYREGFYITVAVAVVAAVAIAASGPPRKALC